MEWMMPCSEIHFYFYFSVSNFVFPVFLQLNSYTYMYAGMQWEENSGIYSVYRLQWTGKARQWQQSV